MVEKGQNMKRVGVRRGIRGLVFGGAIVGILTIGLATQAWAGCIVTGGGPPHVVGGAAKQANPNNTITTTPLGGPIGQFDLLVASVATGTFAGDVGCTDNVGHTGHVDADINGGTGRLFVCSIRLTGGPTPTTVTATYPGFSGNSAISVVDIPDGVNPLGPSHTNSGSNPPVDSGSIAVSVPSVLFGVVANNNVSTFAADNPPWTPLLPTQSVGGGTYKRTLSPVFMNASSGTAA